MICLLFYLFSTEQINFYVDPIVYKTSIDIMDTINQTTQKEEIFYIEFNCEIPYQQLSYETINDTICSKVIITFKLLDMNRLDSLTDTLYRRFTIPSFSYAAKQQISFVTQFGMHIPEGKFRFRIEVLSGNKQGLIENEIEIKKKNYQMSDILIASDIRIDTLSGYLRKGNLLVFPRPSRIFDERFNNLYLYYEIYDIKPDADSIELTYKIVNEEGKVIRKILRHIEKKFKSQAINFGLNIMGLTTGQYNLKIELTDRSAQTSTQKEALFEIARAVRKDVSYEGMPYYEEIEVFLPPKEFKKFKDLPNDGKRIYLKKFWERYDYFEIAERFEYVDKNYRQGALMGHKTDRGRVYIKYGRPDEIDRGMPIALGEAKPYEHWQYYNGLNFIFVDIRETNEYTLVWTNAEGEQSQPTFYKYLPAEKINLIE